MNVGTAGGSGTSGGSVGGPTAVRSTERTERRDTPPPSAQAQADFESALQARLSKRDGRGDDEHQDEERHEPTADAASGVTGQFTPLMPLQGQNEAAPVAAPRSCDLPPSGTQAKMEAALNAQVAPSITEVGANDPAALWEASLRDPNAIPLDVRVLRGERIGAEANAALTVSVRSSAVGSDVLGRHASKLDERLRKRGVDDMHVRIEDGQDPA